MTKYSFLRKSWVPHVLVGLLYLLTTFYYMTPQFLHCNTTVYGFGDNTGGTIWRHSVSPNSPLWGYEKVTNYPAGENLSSPVNDSASLQYTLYWGLTKVAGQTCGYNLVNIIGFMASSLTMYGFIFALTRRRWIAILSGYAVAFSPYFQVKVGGHMGYGYEAILIGVLWAFYNFIKKQRKKDALILGALIGVCGYWDPYFSLLVITIAAPLTVVWFLLNARNLWSPKADSKIGNSARAQLKRLGLALLLAIVIISPLAAIKAKDNQQINSYVSSSRGNIYYEAKACSILPYEYGVPFVLNPIFNHLIGKKYYQRATNALMLNYKCGIGEDSISISWVVLTTVGLGMVVFLWEKLNKRRLNLGAVIDEHRFIFWGAIAGIIFASALALPPVRYHGIPSPSYALLHITDTWRTLARIYVVVNIFMVTLFALFASYFAYHFKTHKRWLKYLFILMFLVMFVEYQAFSPLKGNTLSDFNFKKDAPAAYYWLEKQSDIKTIAEYPLERAGGESNVESYYLSMQLIHQKREFNSALPNSPQELIRSGLKDLSDPQTVPVLRALGVNTVIVHGVSAKTVSQIPYLKVLYSAPQSAFNVLAYTPTVTHDNIVIAKIESTPQYPRFMELAQGFPRNGLIIHSAADWEYEAIENAKISIGAVSSNGVKPTNASSPLTRACFEIKMAAIGDKSPVTFEVDGKAGPTLDLTDKYQRVELSARQNIVLHDLNGHNMRIQNLGCNR